MAENLYINPQLHRDELSDDVKEYADNLNFQIADLVRSSGFNDFERFLDQAEVGQLKKVHDLMSKLELVSGKGEIPFDEDEFTKKYGEILATLTSQVFRIVDFLDWVKENIETLPIVPPEVFKDNPKFIETLLKIGDDRVIAGSCAGSIVGKIYLNSISKLPEIERNDIYQEIDLSGWGEGMEALGSEFPGGKLRIKGRAGTHLGELMTNGIIEADEAGNFLGAYMSGGEIHAGRAGYDIAVESEGGKIFIDGHFDSISGTGAEVYFRGVKQN